MLFILFMFGTTLVLLNVLMLMDVYERVYVRYIGSWLQSGVRKLFRRY